MFIDQTEIRVQSLEENNYNDGKLFKLKQGWLLRLQLSNNIIHKNVKVYSNLPVNNETQFNRNTYYEYEWKYLENSIKNDDFNKYVEINCNKPGAFNYYFTIDDQKSGSCNFLVDPKLYLNNGELVHADSLQFHTVLSKLLGPLDEWKSRLEVSKQTGYNMIHFTPVQALSKESNSSYSIRDHLNLIDTANSTGNSKLEDLKDIIESIYKDWNMFSICDLVYNHMSNDSEFLKNNPEGAYNLVNSPYLIPSFILDRIFYHTTVNIQNGVYENQGIYAHSPNLDKLETLRHIMRHQEIPKYKLEEFYMIDLNKILENIKKIGLDELEIIEKDLESFKQNHRNYSHEEKEAEWSKIKIKQDPNYRRLKSSIDYDQVLKILKIEYQNLRLDLDLKNSNENSNLIVYIYERFSTELYKQNEKIRNQIENYLNEAVNNVISNYYYFFHAHDGPKWNNINKDQPVVRTYFYFPFEDQNVSTDEQMAFQIDTAKRIQAHNGWVMGDDPLRNFASEESTVYFRRQLIPWGDSVKLRFGSKRDDNPELWDYMAKYTEQTAQIFHGVRLDNCHSTPIHVAQYFLDIARKIRPNLFVIAELFTNSESIDNKFVSELGITSLVRESMGAWNANELGRLVHRFGGIPVGSFYQHPNRPILEGIAHAIFYDVTHDNECLIKVRSVYDALASSSLVLMSDCACGSTRGFDELVPHHINVVTETRPYSVWSETKQKKNEIDLNSGILRAKLIMNNLHFQMGVNGYSQIYVDQFDNDTTVVTRHNPSTHESFILMARTSFSEPNEWTPKNIQKPLQIPSKIESIQFEMYLEKQNGEFIQDDSFINGLNNFKLNLIQNVEVENLKASHFIDRIDYDGSNSWVHFKYFPPGAVICLYVVLNESSSKKLPLIRQSIAELLNTNINVSTPKTEIEVVLNQLNYDELNILLYRCSDEDISEKIGLNVYDVPKYGPLIYSGLQGFMNVLEKQRLVNNLGHPIYENLRNGDWMMDYIGERLKRYYDLDKSNRKNLLNLSNWLNMLFKSLSCIPRYLIPCYFDLVITGLYSKCLDRCIWLMKSNNNFDLINSSYFIRSLALGSVSLMGDLRDSKLPDTLIKKNENSLLSLSAGLPHFSTSYMRNWGRDTFISIPGLLLITNRFQDAENLILCYASCLRHGLIPNLLGEGKSARYNCRDAVWWWLKSIKDFTEKAPNGYDILNKQVYRLYPTDDSEYPKEDELEHKTDLSKYQKLSDIIQEALTVHVNGLKFRERNAGPMIDDRMKWEGFNNEIGVNLETGFVFGGNKFNAGTWMDKMGSSEKTGNNGYPATPRDGSAVELIGLSRCALEFLIKSNQESKYPYDGVLLKNGTKLTWVEWAEKIDSNFEKYFFIDQDTDGSPHINKRFIYKDTLNSTYPWCDYQLRPNFLIALCVAPQMVNKEHAKKALEQVKNFLMNDSNSIGIKTLDESDFNYNGYYDNSNDSYDRRIAQGFNYHNGPEWLWPVGYYLRCLLTYYKDDTDEIKSKTVSLIKQHFGKLNNCLANSDWKSLPELTNKNGEYCYFSCVSQAWSLATILEVTHDLAFF